MESERGMGDGHITEIDPQTELDSKIPVVTSSKVADPGETTAEPDNSDTGSESGDDEDAPLYENLPEFQDVTPIPYAEHSVMPIAYTDRFKSVFGYFRAIAAAGEHTIRALRVCEDAAKLNAANYAIWMYRRRILEHLKMDYRLELIYISKVILKNPKNYQVWFHRQRVIEKLGDPSDEFRFTAKVFQTDAKNYHAWQYRQFVLKHFKMLENDELAYTAELIGKDAFNNSAWMQRYFVLEELPRQLSQPSFLDGPKLQEEIKFTFAEINKIVHNESPWSYLRGILKDRWEPHYGDVAVFCEGLYNQNMRSPFLLAFMVDMYDEDLANAYRAKTKDDKMQLFQRCVDVCRELAEVHDKIRSKYWNFFAEMLKAKHAALFEA